MVEGEEDAGEDEREVGVQLEVVEGEEDAGENEREVGV